MEPRLDIEVWDLGGNNLEAYYYETRGVRAMAIDPDAGPERRRLWELVAHGIERVHQTTRRLISRTDPHLDGFFFFGATSDRDADPLAVNAAAKVIAELEPEWVSAIEGARLVADDLRVISAWSEVPIEAVQAVLKNWRVRL